MPITTPPEAAELYGDDAHFEHVLDHLFVPALDKAGYDPIKPTAQGADLIQAEIVKNLEDADLVLCDISLLNPNVFFELGIRTALDRSVSLVRDEQTRRIPFDTGILNFHTYQSGLNPWELEREIDGLAEHVQASAERADGRNALWRYFGLTQRGSDAINAAPSDPQASALELILDEIRSLRRADRSPTAVEGSTFESLGIKEVNAFLREAVDLVGVGTAKHEIDMDGRFLTLDFGVPLDPFLQGQVMALANRYGLRVHIRT